MISKNHKFSFMVIVILKSVADVFGNKDCVIERSLIICENELPQLIPDNVTEVIIKDFRHETIDNKTFHHRSWRSIYILDVTVNLHINFRLYDYNFFPLKHLKALGIHSPGLTLDGDKHILYGLAMLEILDLSSCYQLQTHDLYKLLDSNKTLDTLILDQTSLFDNRRVVMDNAFFVLICKAKIRKVSLSGCNLLIQGPLNFSNISFTWNSVNVSNTTITRNNYNLLDLIQLTKLFANVKQLDMSYISNRFWDVDYSNWFPICSNNLFYNLEYLVLNHFASRTIIVNNSFHDLSNCNFSLKTLHLRSNKIHYYNMTTVWPNKTRLFELDLSFNDMEYLSPRVYGPVFTLETFLLSHNKLYRMASFPEFRNLFVTFKKLRHLDVSHNHLTWLPFKMFLNNNDLAILDLSYNKLASVRFKIVQLTKMEFLNLKGNMILFIDGVDLDNLVMLSKKLARSAIISFYDNPLLCSCESAAFIEWLYSSVYMKRVKEYSCSLEGHYVSIDANVISKAQYLCIRSKIIIGSVISAVGIISIASFVTLFLAYRKRKGMRKRRQINFVEEFKDGALHEKFLCFLSFSSDDEGNYINEIHTKLGETLKELIVTDQEVMCVGDRYFNPGFPIVDEILRCISESCVVAFIVSNNFCESHWCQMELREAYELNKPIILICKEETDVMKMTPLMFNIFRKFTRAKIIVMDDGRCEIIPNFEQLSKSILQLAVTRYGNALYIQN